jgi:hypothetical protein
MADDSLPTAMSVFQWTSLDWRQSGPKVLVMVKPNMRGA